MSDTSLAGRDAHARAADAISVAGFNKISWGAVLAGVVVALTAQLVLNLLGVGIGAATIDPGTADNPSAGAFSIAAALWYVAAGLIGAFAGGYVASRLSGRPSSRTGAYHGLVSWAATTLVVLYLLTTSLGAVVGGALGGLSSAIGGVGRGAANAVGAVAPSVAAMNPMAEIERQVRVAGDANDPQAIKDGAVAAVQSVINGDPAKADEARARAADALAKAQNITPEQARTQVGEYEARYRSTVDQAKRQATDAAVTTAKAASRGALLGFLALALGAVAAWFGGAAGAAGAVRAVRRA